MFGVVFFHRWVYIFLCFLFMDAGKSVGTSLLTPLRENVQWSERTLQIRRWEYCEAEKIMEVEIDIDNQSFDGKIIIVILR